MSLEKSMAVIPSSAQQKQSLSGRRLHCSFPLLQSHSFSRCIIYREGSRHCAEGILEMYLLINKGLISFAGLVSLYSQLSPFSIWCIHTTVVLAAAGHSGDKSGKVSLGNGLQKGSGS